MPIQKPKWYIKSSEHWVPSDVAFDAESTEVKEKTTYNGPFTSKKDAYTHLRKHYNLEYMTEENEGFIDNGGVYMDNGLEKIQKHQILKSNTSLTPIQVI